MIISIKSDESWQFGEFLGIKKNLYLETESLTEQQFFRLINNLGISPRSPGILPNDFSRLLIFEDEISEFLENICKYFFNNELEKYLGMTKFKFKVLIKSNL